MTRGLRFPYLDETGRTSSVCRAADVFSYRQVVAPDGFALDVYSAGDPAAPLALLVNPLGISCLFMGPLARRLASEFHVVTWEHRGLPDTASIDGAWPLQTHCDDMAAVLDGVAAARGAKAGKPRCQAMVSYCSGAHLAILALGCGKVEAGRLCLVSPSFDLGPHAEKTAYQTTVMPMWPRVVRDGPRMAALVGALLRQVPPACTDPLDAELDAVNRLPFRDDTALMRYAAMLAQSLQLDVPALLGRIDVPALVLHSEHDDIVHRQTAICAAGMLVRGTLSMQAEEGHFAIYKSAATRECIARYLTGDPA